MTFNAESNRRIQDMAVDLILTIALFGVSLPVMTLATKPSLQVPVVNGITSGFAVPTIPAPTRPTQITPVRRAYPQTVYYSPLVAPQVVSLRRAIIGQESAGNFRVVNRHSGALGYGQIMPANLPSWSRQAVGRVVSRQEFLSSPQLQLQIIDYKLNQYWQEAIAASYGNEAIAVRKVASRWYSGRMDLYDHSAIQYYNGNPYPSIRTYTLSVLRRYQTLS